MPDVTISRRVLNNIMAHIFIAVYSLKFKADNIMFDWLLKASFV